MTPTSPNLPEPATCEDCLTVVAWISPRNIRYLADLARKSVSVFPHQDAEDEVALVKLSDAQLLAAEVERLRAALLDVVKPDIAYLGADADTGNPNSLYCRVRRARALLEIT